MSKISYICTHPDSEEISEYGRAFTPEEALLEFEGEISANDDYEDGESIDYVIYEEEPLPKRLKDSVSAFEDDIIENMMDNAEVGDWVTWPTDDQLKDLENSILKVCREWVDRQEQWKLAFTCGKTVKTGEFVKGASE